jgi:hypothetical protein
MHWACSVQVNVVKNAAVSASLDVAAAVAIPNAKAVIHKVRFIGLSFADAQSIWITCTRAMDFVLPRTATYGGNEITDVKSSPGSRRCFKDQELMCPRR